MTRQFIKEIQYNQFLNLITYATCDSECENCYWKDEFYDDEKYLCLLKQLQDIVRIEKEIRDDSKVDYLKSKKGCGCA